MIQANVSGCEIKNFDLSLYPDLWGFICEGCGLTELDVSKNPKLYQLICSDNELTDLNLSKNPKLEVLECSNNQLTQLDLSNNPLVKRLECDGNKLTKLDISCCPKLVERVNGAIAEEKDGSIEWNLPDDTSRYVYERFVMRTDKDVDVITEAGSEKGTAGRMIHFMCDRGTDLMSHCV